MPPLPHRSSPISRPPTRRPGAGNASTVVIAVVKVIFVLQLCASFYLAGSLLGHNSLDSLIHGESMGVGRLLHGDKNTVSQNGAGNALDCKDAEEKLIQMHVKQELEKRRKQMGAEPTSSSGTRTRFPKKTMDAFANGMARVKKDHLHDFFNFGNPMTRGQNGGEDAIVLYHSRGALPSSDKLVAHAAEYDDGKGIPLTEPETATENCDAMNVVFTDNPGNVAQCTAIIGNFESYHIQRWMRVDTVTSSPIMPDLPLVPVSRGYASRGRANFVSPPYEGKNSPVQKHWKMLRTFLQNVDSVLDDLKPILKKVARNNAVVIMTCNMGQSALLMNFACSARRRGFDLGNILVFPTDLETKELADGLGLATYFDEKNMGPLPSGEARRYGDRNFRAMMYAKVLCVLYPSMLGYDVLFQDVDVVWIRNPMEYFHSESSISNFDVIFQHDGSYSVRFAPYAANSGFYYVRANKRTQYLFTSLLFHSDLIIMWDSHQQLLIQLLAEHSSLFGLNVKILDRDTNIKFPGGHHFHMQRSFMKSFVKRETESYIFHMSWTENKDNKLLFLRQLGEWYVTDKCIGKTLADIIGVGSTAENSALVQPCCAMEPIFSCHYRDKPSVLPCNGSNPIDKGKMSFW